MAIVSFPEPKDLILPYEQTILDGRSIDMNPYSVSNPHPGFGKDPNILNELGHTKYPRWIGNVIVNNEEEENVLLNPEVKQEEEKPADPPAWPSA
jgi:hypothetical protein